MIIRRWFFNSFPIVLLAVWTQQTTGQTSREAELKAGLDVEAGRALFERNWVSSPASTTASDGLGPLYNARSCQGCHSPGGPQHGHLPVMKLQSADAYYGQQLQTLAVPGLAGEVALSRKFEVSTFSFADGEQVVLRRPVYGFTRWSARGAEQDTVFSPRMPPSLAGVGLLEQIPEAAIVALADPGDSDKDGVSGRVSRVTSPEASGLGRFGWQAEQVSLYQQTALALSLDLGMGNPVYPDPYGDCTALQTDCRRFPHGNSVAHKGLEAGGAVTELLTDYLRTIPVKQSGAGGRSEAAGAALFTGLGCGKCHQPEYAMNGDRIAPYTDLLLHDMGPALADSDFAGNKRLTEWRTAPLWELGNKVRTGAVYLHDGRARSLTEAILWHGGEAESAASAFAAMTKTEREALIAFLVSL